VIRTTYLVLLGATVLVVVSQIVIHDHPPSTVQDQATRQPSTAVGTFTTSAMHAKPRNVERSVTRDPGPIAPIEGYSAEADAFAALSIGERRSVDEPAWWDTPAEAIEIGEPLDADNPIDSWKVSDEVVDRGDPLDVNDPTAWAHQQASPMPREIGKLLDADSPWQEQSHESRQTIDIGPRLEATPFGLSHLQNETNDVRRD
jgi:hypothetical protein